MSRSQKGLPTEFFDPWRVLNNKELVKCRCMKCHSVRAAEKSKIRNVADLKIIRDQTMSDNDKNYFLCKTKQDIKSNKNKFKPFVS